MQKSTWYVVIYNDPHKKQQQHSSHPYLSCCPSGEFWERNSLNTARIGASHKGDFTVHILQTEPTYQHIHTSSFSQQLLIVLSMCQIWDERGPGKMEGMKTEK